MEKRLKFTSLLLVFCFLMSFGSIFPATALEAESISEISSVQYISQQDAEVLVYSLIRGKISDSSCPWNASTSINEVVELYDFNQNANSYLFRLKTCDLEIGYVFVDANSLNPSIQAYGYDCDYMLDSIMLEKKGRKALTSDKIICPSDLVFAEKSDDRYRIIETDALIQKSDEELNELYRTTKINSADNNSIERLNLLSTQQQTNNAVIQADYTITNKIDLPNIFNYTFYTTSDFSNPNNCAPVAALNFILYWTHCHPNKAKYQSKLWLGKTATYNRLYNYLGTTSNGTNSSNSNYINALSQYANYCSLPIAGSDSKESLTMSYNWYVSNITNNNAILVSVSNDSTYNDHAMCVLGIEQNTDGNFLRIANGWTTSLNTWYRYKGSLNRCRYVRWA